MNNKSSDEIWEFFRIVSKFHVIFDSTENTNSSMSVVSTEITLSYLELLGASSSVDDPHRCFMWLVATKKSIRIATGYSGDVRKTTLNGTPHSLQCLLRGARWKAKAGQLIKRWRKVMLQPKGEHVIRPLLPAKSCRWVIRVTPRRSRVRDTCCCLLDIRVVGEIKGTLECSHSWRHCCPQCCPLVSTVLSYWTTNLILWARDFGNGRQR